MDAGERGRHGTNSNDEPRAEPERHVGGSEWLLQQLGGGRLKNLLDTQRAQAPESAPEAEPAPKAEPAPEAESGPVPEPEPERVVVPERVLEPEPEHPADVYQWPPAEPEEPFSWNLEPEQNVEPETKPASEKKRVFEPEPQPQPAPAPAPPPASYSATPARSHVNHTDPVGRRMSPGGSPKLRSGSRRPLLIAAIGVAALLVLGGLLLLGFLLGGQAQPVAAPTSTAEPSAEPTPTPSVELPAVGPLPAGTYAWNQLLGGECLQPMDDAWAETFAVVDCAGAHAAQVVRVAEVTDPSVAPGTDAMAAAVAGACQAAGVIDVDAARGFGDVQVQGTYPVTDEQWAAGERDYYCFVSRAGGEPLTGSLVGTP